MKAVPALLLLALLSPAAAAPPTRRAVIVGIAAYRPATPQELAAARPALLRLGMLQPGQTPPKRDFGPLYGSVNDATAIRDLLESRFGFLPQNVIFLADEHATRQAILDALQRAFVTDARDGDQLFFYFAGHGSQQLNSLSADKSDHRDETIVPWDANAGYFDIRDKELARIFNAALAAHPGVKITAVFDSCHSGSIARGLAARARDLPPDPRDARDPYGSRPGQQPPELHGALIFSAARFDQEAEEDERKPAHGYFTEALLATLQQNDAGTPAEQIFQTTSARMQVAGQDLEQQPVIAGTTQRLHEGLFGDPPGTSSSTLLTVLQRNPDAGTLTLNGGLALGLAPGAVLAASANPALQITVVSVDGLSRATAKPARAADLARLPPGATVLLRDVAFPGGAKLHLWMPPATLSAAQIAATARALAPVAAGGVGWVTDPAATPPSAIIAWNGHSWQLSFPNTPQPPLDLGPAPTAATVAAHLHAPAQLWLWLPPAAGLAPALAPALAYGLAPATSPGQADYWLAGSRSDAGAAYEWIRPAAIRGQDRDNPLPAFSARWIRPAAAALADAAGELLAQARDLGRAKAWLSLPGPADAAGFPYHLVLTDIQSGRTLNPAALAPAQGDFSGHAATLRPLAVTDGACYGLSLGASPADLDANVPMRYFYIFVTNPNGVPTLLFPPDGGDGRDNSLGGESVPTVKPIHKLVFSPPDGVSTIMLLSTDAPLGDLSVFKGESLPAGTRDVVTPLLGLLSDANATAPTHARDLGVENWNVERLEIRNAPAATPPPSCKKPAAGAGANN